MLSTKELCEYLNVSSKTLYNYRERGMPFIRVGGVIRYEKEKVMEWLANN